MVNSKYAPHQGVKECTRREGTQLPPVNITERDRGFGPGDTRQMARARDRLVAKEDARRSAKQDAKERARAKLARQAEREKSGYYDTTMAVANVLGVNHGRRIRNKKDDAGKRRSHNLVRFA